MNLNKKYRLILLFLTISHLTYAQFAKIIDKDGYVNVRKEASISGPVVSKIKTDEIVYAFPDEKDKNWVMIDYTDHQNQSITGYVHSSRIKFVESYREITSTTFDENEAIFVAKDIIVEIRSGKFDYENNKKYFSSTKYDGYTVEDKFKGQEVWGTDGTIPISHYTSIKATIKGKTVQIPEKDIETLFNVNNEFAASYYDDEHDCLFITSTNGDGAGGYVVLFEIVGGKYKARVVTMPF